MFDIGVASGTAVERLRAATAARTRIDIAEAEAIADLAAEHAWDENAIFDVVGVRPVRIGADGTALVDEFLPLEVAALKGISVASATWLIRDVVNLKARHPLLWTAIRAGHVQVWQARQLLVEVSRYDLTAEQAGELDLLLAPKLGVLPWPRVLRLARGMIVELAADKIAAMAAEARAARYVRKHPTEDPTVGFIAARVDTADAIFFDAMIDRIADILGERGDTDPKDVRRAKAVGILATPERARLILAEAGGTNDPGTVKSTDPRLLPKATVYVHVAEESLLHGHGPCRVEDVGPLSVTMLKLLVGNCQIRLAPVIRPYADVAVDSYEIPDWMRRQVLARSQHEAFPHSSRTARRADLDHTNPYRPGIPGQTRPSNLGPLTRRAHRAKTHGGWTLEQPKPGIFHWTTPDGDRYRITPNGTHRIGDNPQTEALDEHLWNNDHDRPPDDQHPPDTG